MITSLRDLSSDSRRRLYFLSILTMALLLLASTPRQSHAQDDDLTLELTDQIGGFAGPAAAAFPFAFISHDNLLRVVDLTSPTLDEVAFLLLPDLIRVLAVHDGHLLVGHGNTLTLFDLTDPANPVEAGSLTVGSENDLFTKVAISGDVAFMGQGENTMQVINLADPANPTAAATVATGASGLAARGTHLYVVDGDNNTQLRVFDISNPAAPNEVNAVALGRQATFVTVDGDHAYVMGGFNQNEMRIFDLTDPVNPAQVGALASGANSLQVAAVQNGIAYVGQDAGFGFGDDSQLLVVDVSDPANLALLGTAEKDANGVVSAFVFETDDGGGKQATTNVALSGGGFFVFDATTPANPVLAKDLNMPVEIQTVTAGGGNRVFVNDGRKTFEYTLGGDGTLAFVRLFGAGARHHVADEAFLYRVGFQGFFSIRDLTVAGAPSGRGNLATDFVVAAMAVRDGLLYVVGDRTNSNDAFLNIIDISDPDNLVLRGEVALAEEAVDLVVPATSDLVYVGETAGTDQIGQVEVVNVANADAPTVQSAFALAGETRGLGHDGATLYATSLEIFTAEEGWFLQAFDISGTPTLVAEINEDAGSIGDVSADGGDIAVPLTTANEIRVYGLDDGSNAGKGQRQDLILRGAINVPAGLFIGFADVFGQLFLLNADPTKGQYIIRIGGGGDEFTETAQVTPGTALSDGCQTNPPHGVPVPHNSPGTTISARITDPCQDNGWNFLRWAGFTDLTATVEAPFNNQDRTDQAVFAQAALIVAMDATEQTLCPSDAGTLVVALVPLTASELPPPLPEANWILNRLTFTPTTKASVEDIDQIIVREPGGTEFVLDDPPADADGNLAVYTFRNMGLSISAGETVRLELVYLFNPFLCPLPGDEDIREYGVSMAVASDVEAVPDNPFNGTVLPKGTVSSPKHTLACVHNITQTTLHNKIEDGLSLATDNDIVEVCPGVYEENVILQKKGLTLRSIKGPAKTRLTGQAGVEIREVGITVQGFTIEEANVGITITADRTKIGFDPESGRDPALARNVIINNVKGIILQGKRNRISGNYIGLRNDGDTVAPNLQGITTDDILPTMDNLIGGPTLNERNVISGNDREGIDAIKTSGMRIQGNIIGLNAAGTAARGNERGIDMTDCSGAIIGGQGDSMNIISGNLVQGIVLRRNADMEVRGNFIGTDTRGRFKEGFDNGTHGISVVSGKRTLITRNTIRGHDDLFVGDNVGINLDKGDDLKVTRNFSTDNDFGLRANGARNVVIQNNTLTNNDSNIKLTKTTTAAPITGNEVGFSLGIFTGITLDSTHAEIIGNNITDNHDVGIRLLNGSTAIINRNNISGNPDFGILNTEPSVVINAQGNFWGDASGPTNGGSGTGDLVSDGVDFSNFLTEPVTVVAAVPEDTVFVEAGQADSLLALVQNFAALDGTLEITATDEQGWLTGPASFTVTLEDSVGAEAFIHLAVPAGTARGTANVVQIEVVNPADANQRDAVTVLVLAGDATLVGIEEIEDVAATVPEQFALHPNYPNPFNPTTVILYDVPVASRVRLEVYNVLGQRVAQLLDRSQTPGRHRVVWDAAGFPSGLYFVRFQTEALAGSHRFEAVKKMILLR